MNSSSVTGAQIIIAETAAFRLEKWVVLLTTWPNLLISTAHAYYIDLLQ